MSSASKSVMEELHALVARVLSERLEAGEATAADISAAIKFLKDNGIESQGDKNADIQRLSNSLPDLSEMSDEFSTTPN